MALFLLVAGIANAAADEQSPGTNVPGIRVPAGFRVEHFADDDIAHDIHSLTIDAKGRVVVSGPGFVRILIDGDGDDRAESFKEFSDKPATGSQGMFFLGSSLLCSGDDGLLLFRDDNGDDKADGPPQAFLKIEAGGEHHVHSIQKGPDGWWYVMAGNFSGVTAAYATANTSPIRQPVSGTLHRLKPDLSGGEIVADGFRNAYDFAFNGSGDFFTYDSDDERDISLPWYLPTQVFHILPLSNAGYVTPGLKHPPAWADMPPVLAQFGRGSPTGVVCYQHRQFPEPYRGALFALDWTYGRILSVGLTADGSGWKSEPSEFATGEDQFGFAPTDMEVAPDGSLFVSVGGRGTRGSVYRIVHESGAVPASVVAGDAAAADRMNAVLTAPQANASWSRASWGPIAKGLGADAFRTAALDEARRVSERQRAIECLVELFGGLDAATAVKLAGAGSPLVRARAAWAVGRTKPDAPDTEMLRRFLADRDPFVQRCALEAFTSALVPAFNRIVPETAAALKSDDRQVRLAASLLIGRMNEQQRASLLKSVGSDRAGLVWMYLGRLMRSEAQSIDAARVAVDVLADAQADLILRRDAVRLLQLSLGDVGPIKGRPPMFDGYAPLKSLDRLERDLNPLIAKVADAYPTGDAALDHELVRTFSMTGTLNRSVFEKLLAEITDKSLVAEDVHRLAALSQLPIERSAAESESIAKALVNIDIKVVKQNLKLDTNWDDRIGELYAALCNVDPAMSSYITSQPGFGLPGHVLLLSQVPGATVPKAIDGFVAAIAADPEYAWSNDVVFAIGESDKPEHQAMLREQLENLAVRDAVLIVLSEKPLKEDRALYLSGLDSAQLNAVEACANALTKLPRSNDAVEQFQLLSAARRLINEPREFKIRETVMRLLQNNTSQSLGFVFGAGGHKPQPDAMQAWQTWLQGRYPDFKPVSTSEAAAAILARLNEISWNEGDADRGKKLFEKLACSRCHGGRKSLGPDLAGVAKRFSRDDLFAAIVDPNRDISSRYQTTAVELSSGKVLTGLIVYESVDGLLLRDAEHRTYRLESADIESRHQQRNSLMPGGLLKDATSADMADLYRYLQGL